MDIVNKRITPVYCNAMAPLFTIIEFVISRFTSTLKILRNVHSVQLNKIDFPFTVLNKHSI